MKRIAFASIVLMVLTIACTPNPTIVPPTATATLAPIITPTLTPAPTITPTPTPAIAAVTWASDANGKVDPQAMYPLVGAINYKHRKTIDLMMGQLRLAIVTDQDLTRVDADTQKSLRARLAAALDQNAQLKRQLESVRAKLAQSYSSEPNFRVVVENEKPIQAILQQGDDLLRYKVEYDANGSAVLAPWNDFALLPMLTVEGPYILRTDQLGDGEDRRIQFKGMNIYTFNDGPQTFVNAKNYIDTSKNWGSNIIRFLLDIGKLKIDELDKTIRYAEQNGMYVLLSPANDNGARVNLPNERSHNLLINLGDRYNNRGNVLLELLNELGNVNDDKWYDQLVDTDREIRKIKPLSPIFMPGPDFNRNFSYFQSNTFPDDDIVFDVHLYPVGKSNPFRYEFLINGKKYPVFIGEAGGPNTGMGNPGIREVPDVDLQMINLMMQTVDSNPFSVHFAAFQAAPGSWRTSIFNPDGSLHITHGKPIVDNMTNQSSLSRQTNFTN